MVRELAGMIGVAAVVAAGLVQGRWTERWSKSDSVREAAARLPSVPEQIGPWSSRSMELDKRQLEIGEIAGYLSREYVHRPSGDRVSILLVCGRPGPISVHTPDVCYGGVGYVNDRAPEEVRVDAPTASDFRRAFFRKDRADVPVGLRILWAWSSGGPWRAPENPRLAFVADKALYKLYVIQEQAADEAARRGDSRVHEFLEAFLPELTRSLFPLPAR